jgi:hypothetical protein
MQAWWLATTLLTIDGPLSINNAEQNQAAVMIVGEAINIENED